MKKKFSRLSFVIGHLSSGFTLIEMLVTVAIITIVSAAIIVGINPLKRIQDAQDSRAKQDVRSVASAVEACLSYANPTTGATNTYAQCGLGTNLTGSTIQGAPFARSIPSPVTISTDAAPGTIVCITETGSTVWWYSTKDGVVSGTKNASC